MSTKINIPGFTLRDKLSELQGIANRSRQLLKGLSSRNDGQVEHTVGWKDNTSSLSGAALHPSLTPEMKEVKAGEKRYELAFVAGNLAFCDPFHVNHDIQPGAKVYPHVHWMTDNTDTNDSVTWRMYYKRAKGHQQEAFSAEATMDITQSIESTAYTHMVAECSDAQALELYEPDELIIITLELLSTSGFTASKTSAGKRVFGLTVDLHYEASLIATKNKAPNFWF